MTPEERAKHCYLGDAVYIERTDQFIILRTGNHQDQFCDNKIYLEQDVLRSMIKFLQQTTKGELWTV